MPEQFEEIYGDQEPERPLECSECKKAISVYYTEIVGDLMTRQAMCQDCPNLQKRLQGTRLPGSSLAEGEKAAGLACGNCGTTLESIRVGTPLGCSICYEVFDDILFGELQAANKVPQRLQQNKKTPLIHIGRRPGETQEINPALQLLALNEALSATLEKEDYEQAARLRDQIKELTDSQKKEEENKHDK